MSYRRVLSPKWISVALLGLVVAPAAGAGCTQPVDLPPTASEAAGVPVDRVSVPVGQSAERAWEEAGPTVREAEPPWQMGAMTAEDRLEMLHRRFIERVERSPYGSVSGRVTGLDEAPLAGVKVSVAGQETTTDADGRYELPQITLGTHVVSFERHGYVFTQRPVGVEHGRAPTVDAHLLPRSTPHRFDAEKGARIVEGPLTIDIDPKDLVFERTGEEVKGEIEATITAIDPRQPGHTLAAPARLEAIDSSGQRVGLISYGMVEVEMSQDGRKIQVRPGEAVTVALDVAEGFDLEAGDAIPMWHHDTSLGLWVQERDLDAKVEDQGGARVAVAELPHFSAWNFDVNANASCAHVTAPASFSVTDFRVLSTTSTGGDDGLWNFESQCRPDSQRGSACVTNVPTTSGVYFKLQAKNAAGTWCDLQVDFNGTSKTVFHGGEMQAWLDTNANGAGTWCGAANPTPAPNRWLSGTYVLGSFPEQLPPNHVRLGIVTGTPSCPNSGIGTGPSGDSGFASMATNARSSTYKNNFDRDATTDGLDKCAGRNAGQADANGNGIGDACEAWCYVPASDPYWSWYDYDADGIDDLCDNRWSTYNPSQYIAPGGSGGGTTTTTSGSGGGSCFIAGTSVTMADGSTRPIEKLVVGDQVLAYDVEAGRPTPSTVTHTFIHPDTEGLILVNGDIVTTTSHPFFVNGKWVRADALRVGDELVHVGDGATALSAGPEPAEVTSLESKPGSATTYNIEVATHHNYFAGGVLVHNLKLPLEQL